MTVSNIGRAKTIFGPSLIILKVKTTRQDPETFISNYVAVLDNILQANKYVTLFGDIFFVSQIIFFAMISDHLKFNTANHIHTWKYQD